MNRQRLIGFIVALVVLVGVIAAVNHYYFQPKVLLTMPNVEGVKVPAKTRPSVKPDLYAGTMEQILAGKEDQELAATVISMVKRNPFLWPGEPIETPATQTGVQGRNAHNTGSATGRKMADSSGAGTDQDFIAPEFKLSMVIVGETRNLALVNNQFVTEGNTISGYEVVKIEPRAILLAGKDDKQRLTLEPGGPLQYNREFKKENTLKKDVPISENAPLSLQTQLKEVLNLYSDPNLLLK